MAKEELFTISDVAEILNVSKQTLKSWEKKKKIPTSRRNKLNNWRVYTKEDIEKIKNIILGEE